jgi:hypothetical protein
MSGIIFNGEDWNPEKEDKETFINRVINKSINKTIDDSINDFQVIRIETDGDTDDINTEDISDSEISDNGISTDDDTETDTDEENDYNETFIRCLNDIKRECKRGGFITVNSCKLFMNIQEQHFINKSMYYNNYKELKDNIYNVGDVIKVNHEYLKHFNFYEVVKINKKNIKCKALNPVLLVKHEGEHGGRIIEGGTGKAYLFKYTKGKYNKYLKSMIFKKTMFNKVYDFKDYIFSIVN